MARQIPHLRKTETSHQLIVDGESFLMLAGEVQNSQFSSARYMKDIWPRLKDLNSNTVFGSVAWEQIEPVEGTFVFDELDEIILDARKHDLKLVVLWFGTWKNGLSTYVPGWVKRDSKRFPRAKLGGAHGKNRIADVLSPFDSESQKADAKAFSALMQHLKEVHEQHSTVIMVQVQNEVGILGDSRDRSKLAEEKWNDPVPPGLISRILEEWTNHNEAFRKNFARLQSMDVATIGSWADLPGEKHLVEELFMAYHYSLYVEEVAAAGKAAYPLPFFTNVWQNYAGDDRDQNAEDIPTVVAGGGKPGDYPSGGGVANVLDIWKTFAPSLDFVAPDIYLNDFARVCSAYRHRGQPLLIPEMRRDEYGARRIWTAFGSYQCLGTTPFGIDTLSYEEDAFRKHYGLLSSVRRHVLDAQARPNASIGFFFDEVREDGTDPSPTVKATFGDWKLTIERSFVFGRPSAGSGMVIHTAANGFLLIGWGFQVTFNSTNPKACFDGLLRFEEKEVVDAHTGQMRTLRLLNGDETRSGQFAIMPSESPDNGGFPIPITIPANTGIAVVEPYALLEDEV